MIINKLIIKKMNKQDILRHLSIKTNFDRKRLEDIIIKSPLILDSVVVNLIKELEQKTKRTLLLQGEKPLQHINDKVTFLDIARYFSASRQDLYKLKHNLYDTNEKAGFLQNSIIIGLAYRLSFNIGECLSDDIFDKSFKECRFEDRNNSWLFLLIDLERYADICNEDSDWVTDTMTVREVLDVLSLKKLEQ